MYALSDATTAMSIVDYIAARSPHILGRGMPDFRITPTHIQLRTCPICAKPTKDMPDNLYKLYVSVGSSAYYCHRCSAKGSWYDFKNRLGGGFMAVGNDTNSSLVKMFSKYRY
jgi:twinkle protein